MSMFQRKGRTKEICYPQASFSRNTPTFLYMKQGQPHNTLIKITLADCCCILDPTAIVCSQTVELQKQDKYVGE